MHRVLVLGAGNPSCENRREGQSGHFPHAHLKASLVTTDTLGVKAIERTCSCGARSSSGPLGSRPRFLAGLVPARQLAEHDPFGGDYTQNRPMESMIKVSFTCAVERLGSSAGANPVRHLSRSSR